MATKKAGDGKKATPAASKSGAADLGKQFEQAAVRAKQLVERPDNDTLLRLYALYKQGSEGDVKGERPGLFDFVGGAKYDAWAKLKGTAPDAAKQKYVDLVDKLAR
jgi:acyl-CoA-binding protein